MSIQFDFANETLERMSGRGVFLTVGEDKPNTMTIGWGSISVYWGKPIFIVPVRHSRYSYSILEDGEMFTVSVPPLTQEMNNALGICGSRSGRDTDKYELAGLSLLPGRTIKVPVIAGCDYYYECRVLYSMDLDINALPYAIQQACYKNGDEHRLYFGEITAAYKG